MWDNWPKRNRNQFGDRRIVGQLGKKVARQQKNKQSWELFVE